MNTTFLLLAIARPKRHTEKCFCANSAVYGSYHTTELSTQAIAEAEHVPLIIHHLHGFSPSLVAHRHREGVRYGISHSHSLPCFVQWFSVTEPEADRLLTVNNLSTSMKCIAVIFQPYWSY
jgi:hypothetical protein